MNAKLQDPSSARYSMTESKNGVRASIPAPTSLVAVVLLCVWLIIVAVSELVVLRRIGLPTTVLSSPGAGLPLGLPALAFFALWLLGWTAVGLFALARLLWVLFGSEVIGVEAGSLIHRFQVFGVGRTRAFAVGQIARLRAAIADRNSAPLGRRAGSIAFNYGARSHRIGQALEEKEASELIQKLKPWLPEGAIAPPMNVTEILAIPPDHP